MTPITRRLTVAALTCVCALLVVTSLSGCAKQYGGSTAKDPDIYEDPPAEPPEANDDSGR